KAETEEIRTKLFVSFVVDEDGSVINPIIKKGTTCPEIDKQVLERIKMLKFEPGKQNGKPVKVQYNFPIIIEIR
ncbi:MAG: TonB family protein, partial [Bacteroidota bacterium]|nr:TonB family protein [Bacteroidota bacterium]